MRSAPIKNMSILNESELQALLELKKRLAEQFTLREVILFGSKVRGDADTDSDLDVLVLIEEPKTWKHREMISDSCLDVNMIFDANISCLVENHAAWEVGAEHILLPFKDNVMREGVIVEF
jgi:predicted nucleotidyltransferase